nr:(2Fe-2S)-binding protein [Bacillus pumilus]
MDDLVCQCQSVTKGTILNTISVHQLTSLEEVQKQTGANSHYAAAVKSSSVPAVSYHHMNK